MGTTTAATIRFTVETMTAIGGKRWRKNGHDRVYINHWAELAGLKITRYNTGNISSATYQGEAISNSQAYKILGTLAEVWFDANDGKLHCRYGGNESRIVTRKELWQDVINGIRAAIAAL